MINWLTLNSLQNYQESLSLMEGLVDEVINGIIPDSVMLLEYLPVITGGTSANPKDLVSINEEEVIYTGRGGKFTYHGPGQRVIYPIIDLKKAPWNQDLKFYINFLQNAIIASLAEFKIAAFTHPTHVGIWVEEKGRLAKIAAIGIRARKWVSFHGAAVNINPELAEFKKFIPCGINDLGVTSLAQLGVNINLTEFDEVFKKHFNL